MKKTSTGKTPTKTDLSDSADDKKHLQQDKGTLDLPDIKDIPGQEHVKPLLGGEYRDTTISSDDEEGKGILDNDDELEEQLDANVTKDERELLDKSEESSGIPDDISLAKAKLDNIDEDGTPLNEQVDVSGDDLDVPGEEDDESDDDEDDEENGPTSLNDDKEDDITNRQ